MEPPAKEVLKPQPFTTKGAQDLSHVVALTTIVAVPEPISKHIRWNSHSSLATSSQEFESPPLLRKRHSRFFRHARHTVFNVYRRLFSIVFLLNIVGIGVLFSQYHAAVSSAALLADLATAAAANIMVALWIRQDYVVNGLFKLTWLVPHSAPLRLRRVLAKIYEFGGVHSGAAVCSVIWFSLFTGLLTKDLASKHPADREVVVLVLDYALLLLLITLLITAYPRFRFSSHNTFENFHRWGGWFSLALFWVELVVYASTLKAPQALILSLIKLPAFWFLLISSFHCIYPWFRLHKLQVIPEKLSDHAIRLHFDEKVPLFVGLRISDSPLTEWHSFACIPARDGFGGSVLISDAGDWTRKTIRAPRSYYWVKGVPVTGVLCMARIFRKVVVVTTGSGIGPCLAVIQDVPEWGTQCRVIWSTPDPLVTYGLEICQAVRDVDKQAVVIDTKKEGRPDLVKKAWDLYHEAGAEAVFVISNPKLTRRVVYGLESRGIPAFGPIWDS